ncbi:hypothetical protein [Staphylococcus simulans]|uniref:hypothetical protein n=1 Tax=Staphylococcus simulans TaxID=1286 RepID=UPI0028A3B635|nr:hypothetical protein [Staphylococcus simulans]MDT4011520.1 hypothetical protein [Staphylococcus simulans]
MDKEVLKRYDELAEGFKQISSHGWETYVHGVWVSSLIYSIVGIILICFALTLITMSWKLFRKEVYYTVPEREAFSYIFGEKKRIIPEHQERDGDREEIYRFIAVGMLVLSLFFIIVGVPFILSNIIGIFTPDYVAIKEIIGDIGGK